MDFLKRLFSRAKEKGYVFAEWTTLFPSDTVEQHLLERNKEWVYISVDKVARAVSAVRFKVMRYESNGDDVEVFDGPMVDFLEHPANDFTGKDFIYLDTSYKELGGNAYWEVKPGNQLYPLIPTSVQPIIKNGRIMAYKYSEDGKERDIPVHKVLHDRYVDPRKPHSGVGRLEKIARWVDTSFYANEFLKLFFSQGAHFGGFIETEEESEERIKLIKLGLANDHVGVANAHKWAVLPKGSKATRETANMAEMQCKELDDQYRDKILAAFGVPKTLIGYTTEVNRASAEASEYIFAKYTVKPIVDGFIEFLNHKVAPLLDNSGKLYFACDEFVPENMEIKLKEREQSLNKQAYKTVNEVRAELGLPPVEGGDIVYNAMGLPLGEKPELLPPGNGDNPDDEKKPKKAAPFRARKAEHKEHMIEGIATKLFDVVSNHDVDAKNHKAFVGRVASYEEQLEGKIRDFNNIQEREVQANLGRITKAVSKVDLFDMETEVGLVVDFVTPLLKGLMIEQAMQEYATQGFQGTLDTEEGRIKRTVEYAAKRLARSYNNTTADLLKSALNEGIAAGDGIDKLADRVRQVYAYSDEVRAKAVARTETFHIANEGSREAHRQSGVVKSLRWYTAENERVCPFCAPLNGKIVGIEEVFYKKGEVLEVDGKKLNLDYRTIGAPPLHTNCRCFIRPEVIEI